ncbi:hypothetical protein GGS21DRAFT_492237 [Xylaria nigripes]|nr:hypothetical protein GGS21DRAFT_492237 [Xylaria nigripes]
MAESNSDWSLLEQIPALPPPPGVHSDFNTTETRAEVANIIVSLTYALMFFFLAVRIYTRLRITYSIGVDDFFSLAAGASITAYTGVTLSLFGNPLGPHQWNVRLSQFDDSFLERTLLSIVLFSISSLLVKTALLTMYLRVFAPNALAKLMIWCGIATIVVFYLVVVIINISFCVPISMTTPVPDQEEWAKKLKASNCSQPVYNINAATGIFGIISDLYVLCIPVSMVYKLRLPLSRRIGIIGIFLTGLLAVAASITSTAFRFAQLKSYDFTWDSIPSYTLRATELNIGLVSGCLPVDFVAFKKMFHYLRHNFGTFNAKLLPWPRRAGKESLKPRTRTPSHAYIADLNRDDDITKPRYKAPMIVISPPTRSFSSRNERSTYVELGSMESVYHGYSRNPG